MEGVDDHMGLGLGQELSEVPNGDVDALIGVMRSWVKRLNVQIDSDMWRYFLQEMEVKEIEGLISRQKYLSSLYRECLNNSSTSL